MKTIAIVCSPGVGDALIFHIAAHHLRKAGFEVALSTPHHFGRWLPDYPLVDPKGCDAIFLQHDSGPAAQEIHALNKPVYTESDSKIGGCQGGALNFDQRSGAEAAKLKKFSDAGGSKFSGCPTQAGPIFESRAVYTFYGSHRPGKHAPLKPGFDYVCDPNLTMADNVAASLAALFGIAATKDNGIKPLPGLLHRRNKKRVVIHAASSQLNTQWPLEKYLQVAQWLTSEGYDPVILPLFPSLEELASFLYESGAFIGNDSGPGHLASCLKIPHLIIGRCEKHMKFWRPGWDAGEIVTPPKWLPNWKGLRLRETHWKQFVTVKNVTNRLKRYVLKR